MLNASSGLTTVKILKNKKNLLISNFTILQNIPNIKMCDSEEDWDAPAPKTCENASHEANTNNGTFHSNQKDGDRPEKQGNSYVQTLKIESKDIGLIIGRGGSNIKRTEEEYQVRLNVDKQENNVKITGDNEDNVFSALQHLKTKTSTNQERGQRSNFYENKQQNSSERSNYENKPRNFSDRKNNGSYNFNFGENVDRYDKNVSNGLSNHKTEVFIPLEPEEAAYEPIDWEAINKKSEIERTKRWAHLPPLTKNFYQEHEEVAKLSQEEADNIRASNNNTTVSRVFKTESGDKVQNDIPNPIFKFQHCFEPYPDLLEEIRKQGFQSPSPIQAQAWPILLKGEDLIGIAQTGTGKTLAFLLPAMIHTEYQTTPRQQRGGPNVLIMAPTRELALQIEKEVNKYSFRGMRAVCVYGGGSRADQIHSVEKGAEIIICTPGRLNDLIHANIIDVNTITYLVLDEADRMLDMGFEPQIRKILLDIRPDRQTIMTSATWPPGVRRLAQSYMNNPIQVCVGTLDLAATHTVTQVVEIIEDDEKYQRAKNFVRNMKPDEKVIIFCGRKTRADDLSSEFTLGGELCQCIHGSRDQADREQAIADISSGYVKILIATDVASRGLDIEDITHVINFDFPRNIEEYVHRVGRTGRAGRNGVSISYLTRGDWGMAQPLIDILNEAGQVVPEELVQMAERFKAMKDRRANEMSKVGNFGGRRGNGGGGGGRGGGRFNRY